MSHRTTRLLLVLLASCCITSAANAQFTEPLTGFEYDRDGTDLIFQPGSFEDLQVVVFQDPQEADVTADNIVTDIAVEEGLPSTEESFVANFVGDGFFGANGTDQFLDIRFQWANMDASRWVLVETLQSPIMGDPVVHLEGVVSFYVNFPDCSAYEFPGLEHADRIGVALLVRETGNDFPQGFQDTAAGDLEFVGVSQVLNADTDSPTPIPAIFMNVTDSNCSGSGSDWVQLTFDFDSLESAGQVIGWEYEGGDGILDATTNGDMVNRGVLAGLVLAMEATDTTSEYVEFLVDEISFESPAQDPTFPPRLGTPIIKGDNQVRVNDILSSATNVSVEVDRSDEDNEDEFSADAVFNVNPAGAPYIDVNISPALAEGDRVRANQTNPSGTSEYSIEIMVNPAAAFSLTLALDEDGNLGASPADFEFVGATSNTPTGKPVFVQNGVWQKIEYSLLPGVEPVVDFAGGNGRLEPDGGLYNIDSIFFTIDSTEPRVGDYDVFVDHVYTINTDSQEVLVSNAEGSNPFPSFRGQTTSTGNSSTLSSLTSYDGLQSNRIQWTFDDSNPGNRCAPYRPAVTFPDTSQAVGMWLLVEDARTNGLPLPEVEEYIVGSVPYVTITNIDTNATNVELLVNAQPAGNIDPEGADTVDITPTVTLELGDSVSVYYSSITSNGPDDSDWAYPRVVQRPPAPTISGTLLAGMTTVTVGNVMNAGNASATAVTLYDGETLLTSVDPAGQASVVIDLGIGLVEGQVISATQTVNSLVSDPSTQIGVGTGVKSCVVINEITYDDSGTDDREFVELYNAEVDAVDISGWQIRQSNIVAPPGDTLPDVTIPDSTILASGDYYVIGNSGVPNVDQVIPSNFFDNNNAAVELLDHNSVVVDTIIYELNKGPVAVSPAEGGFWDNFVSTDDTEQSIARWFDGYDTENNGRDFGLRPITPGETNNLPALTMPYTENFDSGAVNTVVANTRGSFVGMRYINPAATGAANPNVIPASPQGGNAATQWDESGGGDVSLLSDAARYNLAFSCYVYIDATTSPFTAENTPEETEQWSIGIGATGSYYNQNRPIGTVQGANGDSGLVWKFQKVEAEDTGSNGFVSLQLIDENDSGEDGTVLYEIPESAITDGWHTLTLSRNYDDYSASFDSFSTNGVAIGNGPGTLYTGYREYVVGIPSTLRPITIDNLQLTIPTAPPTGACCTDCDCHELTEGGCLAINGSFLGLETDCSDEDENGLADACEAFVPPAPVVVGTLCDGGLAITISGLAAESNEYTVWEGGTNIISTGTTGGADTVVAWVAGGMSVGDVITAVQTAAGVDSDESDPVTVVECTLPDDTIVINEFAFDDSGTDDLQFVELYNAGEFAVDIGGWGIRCSDETAPPADNDPDYGVLDGVVLNPGQYYVMGSPLVPNVDQVIGSTGLFETYYQQAFELVDYTGRVIDTVVHRRTWGAVGIGPAEGGIPGRNVTIEGNNATSSRYLDGLDTDVNGRDFGLRPWTPGTSNTTGVSVLDKFELADVDALSPGDPVPGLPTVAFVGAQVVDPTVVTSANPNAIVASPQGGLCSVGWDPSGGGNGLVSADLVNDGGYDIWAYIDTAPYGIGGAESTTFGILGTTDVYFYFPDPSGLLYGGSATYNGNTGIGWLFEKEDSASLISLKLYDAGAGGNSSPGGSWTYPATIDMTGVPSGWHRLRIDYDKDTGMVNAKYDDQLFTFTTEANLVGSFYVGFRESLQGLRQKIRPPTFDNVLLGDIDLDGNIDLIDFGFFFDCLAGPGVMTPPALCTAEEFDLSDFDGDGDVDLDDFAIFQDLML